MRVIEYHELFRWCKNSTRGNQPRDGGVNPSRGEIFQARYKPMYEDEIMDANVEAPVYQDETIV